MISSLTGRVASLGDNVLDLDVGGIGYEVFVAASLRAKLKIGEELRLSIHLVVREDSLTLFGFEDVRSRGLFRNLIAVNGVGPKLAMAVLSELGSEGVMRAAATADIDAFTSVSGVGKKGAQRLAMELKERLGRIEGLEPVDSKLAEVRSALSGLGYSSQEIRSVIAEMEEDSEEKVEDLIRGALKELART